MPLAIGWNMAIKRSALALVALAGVLCSAALTLPTPVTPETESLKPGECEEYCTRSYPKHTYSEVNVYGIMSSDSCCSWPYLLDTNQPKWYPVMFVDRMLLLARLSLFLDEWWLCTVE